MDIIKFAGDSKKTSMRKAISFFHDNFADDIKIDILLAKCRLQKDGKTIHFYPDLHIDIDAFLVMKRKRKKEK